MDLLDHNLKWSLGARRRRETAEAGTRQLGQKSLLTRTPYTILKRSNSIFDLPPYYTRSFYLVSSGFQNLRTAHIF